MVSVFQTVLVYLFSMPTLFSLTSYFIGAVGDFKKDSNRWLLGTFAWFVEEDGFLRLQVYLE
jgi:hypothetical protein